LSRLQLGPKIAIAVGGVLLLSTTILSTVAVYDVARLRAYLESSHNDTFLPYQQLQAINNALERMEVALLAGTGMTPSQWQAKRLVIDQERRLIRAGLGRYEAGLTLGAQPEMRALLQGYGVLDEHLTREQIALRVLTSGLPRLDGVIDTVSRLAAGGESAAARATYEESAAPVFERMIAATSVLMAMQFEESDLAAQAGQTVAQRTAWSIVLAVVLTLVLALVTIFWFAHHLTSPLRALVRGTRAVQRGDLSQTVAVTTQDEIGVLATAFNQMTTPSAPSVTGRSDTRIQPPSSCSHWMTRGGLPWRIVMPVPSWDGLPTNCRVVVGSRRASRPGCGPQPDSPSTIS
jgi:HAMP domain-containing protein